MNALLGGVVSRRVNQLLCGVISFAVPGILSPSLFADPPVYPVTVVSGTLVIPVGSYGVQAGYSDGEINLVNEGTFLFSATSGFATGLNFLSFWNGGSGGGIVAQPGQNAGNAGFLTATSSGNMTFFGTGISGAQNVAMLMESQGGTGGLGVSGANAGNGGNADGGVTVVNSGALSLSGSFASGGGGILAVAQGGTGGDVDGSGTVGAGGNAQGPNDANAVALTNSGAVILEGTYTIGPFGEQAFHPVLVSGEIFGIQALASGGNSGSLLSGSGGTFASGGSAGAVQVTNSGEVWVNVTPWDDEATEVYGILAASRGAEGSNATSGGSGGSGGSSGPATVVVNGGEHLVAVSGTSSVGGAVQTSGAVVAAVSVGGDGGTALGNGEGGLGGAAGFSSTLPDAVSTLTVNSGTFAAGGDGIGVLVVGNRGGDGGDGSLNVSNSQGGVGGLAGEVLLQISGTAELAGTGDGAVVASVFSQGGAGGIGGTDDTSGNGGVGGRGGQADVVNLEVSGDLSLSSDGGQLVDGSGATVSALGFSASSLGGAGGAGGSQIANSGDGGAGGEGGAATNVTASLGAGLSVTTTGKGAFGVLAQSVGGVGGAGGSTSGGDGGDGGNGGASGLVTVDVENGVSITTSGDSANALVAQSLSGAGGLGGNANGTGGGSAGTGGTGGQAGETVQSGTLQVVEAVGVQNAGSLTTSGENAIGLLAQAITGGGGGGGTSQKVFFADGGQGGLGGLVGSVTVTHSGTISTGPAVVQPLTSADGLVGPGAASHGILAQSIAGGGGAAGDGIGVLGGLGGSGGASGPGGSVQVTSTGVVSTVGNISHGLLAQSIGGGGGDGGTSSSMAVAIGGGGGSGGDGGAVVVTQEGGSIEAQGFLSHGLVAQSIGGGGGNAGAAQTISISSTLDPSSVAIGGSGAVGGHGGEVSVGIADTSVETQGSNATAVLAQSIGGGGGTGGAASSYQIGVAFASSVAVGGAGGAGGDGNSATVTIENSTILSGYAPSLTAWSGPTNVAPVDAHAVVVQSIGGGGGKGGASVAQAMSFIVPYGPGAPQINASLAYAVGGSGGDGGDSIGSGNSPAASVYIADGTSVTALGQGSHAVTVQSIGGGGGHGGDSSATSATSGYGVVEAFQSYSPISLDVSMAVGSQGGGGGNGGVVEAVFGGTTSVGSGAAVSVQTYGDFGNAVLLQSVGGGGGNAGLGSSTTSQFGAFTDLRLGITLGASGGAGGQGGAVNGTLVEGSSLTTYGGGAAALMAQSIGGGGGQSLGGGVTAGGGYAFTLFETPEGKEEEYGDSPFLMAQVTRSIEMGATGASGGSGESVTLQVDGAVQTFGNDSVGVFAQSIGGGGGVGGSASTDASADNPVSSLTGKRELLSNIPELTVPISVSSTLSLANTPGAGGDGGTVNIALTDTVTTAGDWSAGVIAQSVGGGGGKAASGLQEDIHYPVTLNIRVANSNNGVNSGSDGGTAGVTLDGSTISTGGLTSSNKTGGYSAYGLVLQSVGGGGGIAIDGSHQAQTAVTGTAGAPGGIFLGQSSTGQGGGDGNGGDVTLTLSASSTNTITTTGRAAHGLVMQSIGGSGGIGATGNSTPGQGHQVINPPTPRTGLDVYVGGGNFSRGNGGNVQVTSESGASLVMTTSGASAFGVLAQSIGGGGGLGAAQQPSEVVSIGGSLSEGYLVDLNPGGDVEVTLNALSSVQTTGVGAHGVIAQSVGGGGGIANYITGSTGSAAIMPVTGTSQLTNGSGGDVTVAIEGLVSTTGNMAYGLIAQSVGGGGGLMVRDNVFYAGTVAGTYSTDDVWSYGAAGSISVTQSGTLTATGTNSVGIFVQSAGQEAPGFTDLSYDPGSVAVNVNGKVTGGSGPQGAGVWVDGGTTIGTINTTSLTVGETGEISAASGTAIQVTGDGTFISIENNGLIEGSIMVLSSGTMTNTTSGTIRAGASIDIPLDEPGYEPTSFNDDGVFVVAGALENSVGTTTITGNYSQNAGAVMEINLLSEAEFAFLLVDGDATFEGHLNMWFAEDFFPELGYSATIISSTGNLVQQHPFATFQALGLPNGYEVDLVNLGTEGPGFTNYAVVVTAIPEPSVVVLSLAGALFLSLRCRRVSVGR